MDRRSFLKLTAFGAVAGVSGWQFDKRYELDVGVTVTPRSDGTSRADGLDAGTDPAINDDAPAPASPEPETPPAPTTYYPQFGIDTSRYQEIVADPKLLLANGISYHIAKATRGTPDFHEFPKDPLFAESRRNAMDAGLLFGAYHYLNRGNGARQAEAFLDFLDETGGTDNIMCALDVEQDPDEGDLGKPTMDDVRAFTETFQRAVPDRNLLLYAGYYWRDSSGLGNPSVPPGTRLWHAHWVQNRTTKPVSVMGGMPAEIYPIVSKPGAEDDGYPSNRIGNFPHYTIRQITDRGRVALQGGQEKLIDVDISFLPLEELKKLAGPKAVATPAKPFLPPAQALPLATAPKLDSLGPR